MGSCPKKPLRQSLSRVNIPPLIRVNIPPLIRVNIPPLIRFRCPRSLPQSASAAFALDRSRCPSWSENCLKTAVRTKLQEQPFRVLLEPVANSGNVVRFRCQATVRNLRHPQKFSASRDDGIGFCRRVCWPGVLRGAGSMATSEHSPASGSRATDHGKPA